MSKNNSIKEFLSDQKELLTSSLIILACLILFLELPATNFFQRICKEVFFFFIVPILYIKIVLKKGLQEFGFILPKKKNVFWIALGILILFLLLFVFLIKFADFQNNYHLARLIKNNFGSFLFYELVTFNFLFLFQEFFFKGFVLFSLAPKFKTFSVLITALLYCFTLLLERSLVWQAAPLIFFSFFGALLAYKSKSLWLAYLTGLISIISLDSILIFISK